MKKIKILCICIFVFVINFSYSVANNQKFQVDKISKNLRCLICQGQSVYDSQSDFAESLKLLINQKINEGKTDKEIYEFLKNKYGEWIVYDPEFNSSTFLLWGIPLILFIFGGLLIIRKVFINW